jgi:hypothetical protein
MGRKAIGATRLDFFFVFQQSALSKDQSDRCTIPGGLVVLVAAVVVVLVVVMVVEQR